jgi:hypothetical protein
MKALALVAIFAAALTAQIPPVGAAAAPQSTLPGNTVVATVLGMSLTIDDVRKMLENAPPAVARLIQSNDVQDFIQQTFLFRHLSVQERRENHLKDWLTDLGKRFTPTVQNPQFFSQPQLYLQSGGAPQAPPKQ